MDPGDDRATPKAPWSPDADPEPEWVEAIRRGRKARGDRLREVLGSFADDDSAERPPASAEPREDDGS